MKLIETIEAARNVLRFKHMSYRTEQSYVHWIKRFAFWCHDHPAEDHADKVRQFLTHLASDRQVSASTHICTHVAEKGAAGTMSPLDRMAA